MMKKYYLLLLIEKIFSYPNHFSFSPQSIFRAKQITESRIKNNNSMENYGANTMIMTIGYPLGMVKSFKDEKFKNTLYKNIIMFNYRRN